MAINFTENSPTQQTQNICITFIQRRPNVKEVGPTLYKCYTMFSVYWECLFRTKVFRKTRKTHYLRPNDGHYDHGESVVVDYYLLLKYTHFHYYILQRLYLDPVIFYN